MTFMRVEIERILDRVVIIEIEIELYTRKEKPPKTKGENKISEPQVKVISENCQKGDCNETTPKMFI